MTVRPGEAWIAYQWMAGSGDGIFLIRPDGTGRHQLASELAGNEILPDWSPDGLRIAFTERGSDDRDALWVMDADGSQALQLYSCDLPCNGLTFADWAADGKAIYYGFDANGQGHPPTTFGIGRFDLATGKASTILTRDDGMTAEQPRISPDATRVVYTRFNSAEDATASAIYVADVATGKESRLTEWSMWAAFPDWSANGLIVFTTYDLELFQEGTQPTNLYTIKPDGTALEQLTSFGASDTRATQPRWTADGSAIVFTQVDGPGYGSRRLAVIDADGSNRRWLTPAPVSGTHPTLRPTP